MVRLQAANEQNLDTYSHVLPAGEEEAANRVAGLLFGVAEMDGVANP
ncbi:MAG: hypothetical protein QOJ23_5685 [Actinomycetota bacterium]|jgi:hypothetical protein|nr:hypothetical protein [Actinomycetota bacterium]